MTSLGIDIGGTSVKLALLREGQVVWTGQSPFYHRPDTAALIEAIRQAAAGRDASADVAGLCVPGLLDPIRRRITLSVNVPGLMDIVLDDLIERSLGKGVGELRIINDAVATATDLIVARRLGGRVCSIAIGTGVGMGVLDDGKPLFIEGASPGHIGQVDVSLDDGEEVIGPDGGRGSLEGYLGVPAIARRYGSVEAWLPAATVSDPPIRALVRALRICHAIYRPQHVLLMGGIGIRLRRLASEIKAACDDRLTSVAFKGWTLECGESDLHAARGAAYLASRP